MAVSDKRKIIARHVRAAFGGSPRVQAYHHDSEDISIDVLRCDDCPTHGTTSYSTIGLSETPMLQRDGNEFKARLEIAGACVTSENLFPNVLATAAFVVMKTNRLCYPGLAMRDYVSEYFPGTTVPHLYLTTPFLWEPNLKMIQVVDVQVAWLLAIPISDKEVDYLENMGSDSFEELLEKKQIDTFDLHRQSTC